MTSSTREMSGSGLLRGLRSSGSRADPRARFVPLRPYVHTAILVTLALGFARYYLVSEARVVSLSFLFLPVTTTSVVFGRFRGGALSAVCVMAALAPVILLGPGYIGAAEGVLAGPAAAFLTWAATLMGTAYVVGFVSEAGGNRALTQGLGADALASVERERKRMAFDVHDGIAQTATTALMEAQVLEMLAEGAPPEVRAQAGRVRETIAEGIVEIRGMIGQLRPPALAASEWATTLEQLLHDFESRTGLEVEADVDVDLNHHSDSMRICTYRLIQEALSNVERHSRASRVRIGMNATRQGVFLTVSDDGVGFDPTEYLHSVNGHQGLFGMRERAALLAGTFHVESAPGEGTTVRAYIPSQRT